MGILYSIFCNPKTALLKKVFFKSYIKELTMKVGSDVFYK